MSSQTPAVPLQAEPEKLHWKPGTMLYPVPAVLVSCGEIAGVQNLITVSWTGTLCTDPPMCSISVRPERFSYPLIRNRGEFAINLTTVDMAAAVDWCGVKSGKDYDKFKECQLSAFRGQKIAAPLVRESPVNLECRIREIRELGSHHLFISEIVAVHADPAYFNSQTGFFNLAASHPLCYCHGHYYGLGRHIGKFGFSVEKQRRSRKRIIPGKS